MRDNHFLLEALSHIEAPFYAGLHIQKNESHYLGNNRKIRDAYIKNSTANKAARQSKYKTRPGSFVESFSH